MKLASVVHRLNLPARPRRLEPGLTSPGDVVVGRVVSVNPNYSAMELADATRAELQNGDLVVGALGSRRALRGFSGYSPLMLRRGERISLLNLGGVMGRYLGGHVTLGEPTQVEVLGAVGRNIREGALPALEPDAVPPIVIVAGTCMNVGKTSAATALVQHAGGRVGVAKLTGIAALKDTLRFDVAGAARTLSFLDAGWASSIDMPDPASVARSLVAHLSDCDLIVLELGDAILGPYQADRVLADPWIKSHATGVVLAASDLVAVKGALDLLTGYRVLAVTGPVTDAMAGVDYVVSSFGLPAVNAMAAGRELYECVCAPLFSAPAARSAAS